MRLNDAVIENQVFDDVECASMQEFIDKLLNAKDLVADVYVNTHRVCSGRLSLAINNNWIIGCVDERLSLAGSNVIENIAIRVHQTCDDLAEATYILTSYTVMNQTMEGNDVDADLYFKIVSTVPNCTTKCFVPDSVFRSLGTSKMEPVVLDELPTDPTIVPESNLKLTYNATVPGSLITWMLTDNDEPYGGGKGELNLDVTFKYHGEVACKVTGAEYPMFDTEDGKLKSSVMGDPSNVTYDLVDHILEKEWHDMPISNE